MELTRGIEALRELKHAIYRQSWENKRKVLYINDMGAVTVAYETTKGVMAESRYVFYMADLKADDWVKMDIPKPKLGKLDYIQAELLKRPSNLAVYKARAKRIAKEKQAKEQARLQKVTLKNGGKQPKVTLK